MGKIAFVIPWFGLDIPGGAESACRSLVYKMYAEGVEVEVLTTCVKQFNSDWNINYHQAGVEVLNGVTVRRFKVRKRNTEQFDSVNYKFIHRMPVTENEENIFMKEMINSTDLEQYLSEHKHEYKAIIFTPYMFGTTYYGLKQALEKAIVLPAFHDEPYAYMNCFKEIFPKVKGVIFFSKSEEELANKLYDLKEVERITLGLGVKKASYSPNRFKEKFKIENPFLLYAGRKEHGKNVHILLDYFKQMKEEGTNNNLKLVLIGGGQIEIPKCIINDVIDLGFVDEQDKYDAYAAAEVLIQPSTNESFSIVIMESWLVGTPVVVHEHCDVTKRFCEESNGGLYFSNPKEFGLCIDLLTSNHDINRRLGENGQKYVEQNFDWNIVVKRYMDFINKVV